jgi:hypothetical protein
MPCLPSPITIVSCIAQIPHDWSSQRIGHLAYQDQHAGISVGYTENEMVEEQEVSEPHAGAKIVEYVADPVGYTAYVW